jgi:hypothetical protein
MSNAIVGLLRMLRMRIEGDRVRAPDLREQPYRAAG